MTSWFRSSYLVRLYGWWALSLPLPEDGGVKKEEEEGEERRGDLRGGGGGERGGRADEVVEEKEREGEGWGEEVEKREEVGGEEERGGVQGEALWVQKRQRSSCKTTSQKSHFWASSYCHLVVGKFLHRMNP